MVSQFTGGTIGNYSRLWLIITGGILLGVGAVLVVALGSVPFAGGAMVATGGFMAVVGIALIAIGIIVGRRAASTDALMTTGTAGTAQITGLTQTGMYFNENPQIRMQLLVSLPGQTPYATQHTEIVPMMLLGRLNSGAPLQVRVDPMNLNRVAVDWGGSGFGSGPSMVGGMGMPMGGVGAVPVGSAAGVAAAGGAGASGGSGMDESLAQVQAAMAASGMQAHQPFQTAEQGNFTVEQLRAHLRANGQDASATIDKLDDSNKVVGDEHLFTMEMTLKIPGQPDKKLPSSAAMVPIAKAHRLFQGMTVPVKYEATNPNLLMVDWEKI
ncbi:MAG TPA: hypothetical protein VM284_02615 [Candidatus Limnocylindria bacterium]|nr:hypothetical protein [Candidatus Limnocylindria bacterium]